MCMPRLPSCIIVAALLACNMQYSYTCTPSADSCMLYQRVLKRAINKHAQKGQVLHLLGGTSKGQKFEESQSFARGHQPNPHLPTARAKRRSASGALAHRSSSITFARTTASMTATSVRGMRRCRSSKYFTPTCCIHPSPALCVPGSLVNSWKRMNTSHITTVAQQVMLP